MNKNTIIKIIIVSFLNIIAILLIIRLNSFTVEFFKKNNLIHNHIDRMYNLNIQINYNIIRNKFTNTTIDTNLIDKLINDIDILLNDEYLKNYNSGTYKKLLEYKQFVIKKKYKINSLEKIKEKLEISLFKLIKNTQNFLFFHNSNKIDKDYIINIANIMQDIFLHKIDNSTLEKIKIIKNKKFKIHKFDLYNKEIIKSLDNYLLLYNEYINLFNEIIFKKDLYFFEKIKDFLTKETDSNSKIISISLNLVIGFIIIIYIIIITLLIFLENEKKELSKTLEQLNKLYYIDNLTQLFNREKFNKDIENKNEYGFLLINIRKFSAINHIYGIEIGDRLLKEIAKFLSIIKPENSFLYRVGGDEFGILIKKEGKKCKINPNEILEKIESKDFIINGILFKIDVNIGITCIKPYFENAYIALEIAKNSKKEKIVQYKHIINNKEQIKENIEKGKILKEIFDKKDIYIAFQPIFDVKTNKIIKYEVLARIKVNGKLESIAKYLEIIQDNKLYFKLTKLVIDKSFQYFRYKNTEFTINLSVDDIINSHIADYIIQKLSKYTSLMHKLTIEILETESIDNYEIVKTFINKLKKRNVKFAIDDFGSGYSNFYHISQLNIDFIKIDGSLIKNINYDKTSYNIVKLLIEFAHEQDIKIIAEFVENEEIFNILKKLGIDYVQGYYIGKPTLDIETE